MSIDLILPLGSSARNTVSTYTISELLAKQLFLLSFLVWFEKQAAVSASARAIGFEPYSKRQLGNFWMSVCFRQHGYPNSYFPNPRNRKQNLTTEAKRAKLL